MSKTRPVLGMVGSLTLLVGLTAYGVRAYTQPDQSDQPTKAVSNQAVGSQEEFDRIIIERERVIVSQLGLTPEQQRQYDILREEQKDKTHAFRMRRPHRPEEGIELNQWWRSSIQQVFTPEQYALYQRLWNTGSGSVASIPTVSISMAEKDNRILASLGLTPDQQRKVRTHQAKMGQRRIQRQNILQSGNHTALLKHDAETVRINQGMKKILTVKQYKKYCEAWGVGASSSRSGGAYSPARAAL